MDIQPYIMIESTRHIGVDAIEKTGFQIEWETTQNDDGASQIELTVSWQGKEPVHLERAGFILQDDTLNTKGDWRVFIDSGTLAWNGVRYLNDLPPESKPEVTPPVRNTHKKFHRSSLQSVLYNANTTNAVLVGFCAQKQGLNSIDVWPNANADSVGVIEAWQEFTLRDPECVTSPGSIELHTGESVTLDPVWVSYDTDPLELLTRYAEMVKAYLNTSFDTTPITGYMTWYSKAAAIDEDTVVRNLPILQDLFSGYPQAQRPMLILDHGWQKNATLGPMDTDPSRFPHGLQWLAERIQECGIEPGIWHSLTNITEDTPNWSKLRPLLAEDENKTPLQASINLWDAFPEELPCRPVNMPDATLERTRKWWHEQLRRLSNIGMRYFKLDFFALRTSRQNQTQARSRVLHDKAWEAFRDAVTEDTHVAPCSCDTNLALGRCDSVRISADIGEAGKWPGKADHYKKGLSSIASLWYKHRRFWVNDADSVQLGKGCSFGELRIRCTAAALSGGHLMLSEDLRWIEPERLAYFRRLLPSVTTAAKPLDLFDCPFPEGYPAIWQWDVETAQGTTRTIALFNMNETMRTFRVSPDMFGIAENAEWVALEWWQNRWLGRKTGDFTVHVPPLDVAVIHGKPATDTPSVVSCSHHPSGEYILETEGYDAENRMLQGNLVTRPKLKTVLFGQMPKGWKLAESMREHAACDDRNGLWQCEVLTEDTVTPFSVAFTDGEAPKAVPKNGHPQ